MKHIFMKVFVVLCVGLLGLSSFAQDDTLTTFEFEESGASISFPSDWEQSVADDGALEIFMDTTTVFAYDSIGIAAELEDSEAESPEELLDLVAESILIDAVIGDEAVDLGTVKLVDLDGREVARLPFEIEDASGAFVAVPMDDESLGLVLFLIPTDDLEEFSPIIDEIIASFNVGSVDGGSTATGEACNLSTSQSGTV